MKIKTMKYIVCQTWGGGGRGGTLIQRCRLRAGNAVWWPGLAKQILSTVQNCHICSQTNPLVVEPMISLELPAYPWQTVSSDLFEMKGNKNLLVVDSFS